MRYHDLMRTIYPGIDVPREAIADFCKRWKIAEFALFGSAARRELRPDSDIDVMVTFASDNAWSLWDVVDMKAELAQIFGRDVDIVERGAIRNPYRHDHIMRDLAIVYAA